MLTDAGGTVLNRIGFEPMVSVEDNTEGGSEEPSNLGYALIQVPMDPNVVAASIEQAGAVIGSIAASANPPSVTVLSPNGGETLSGDTATFSWTVADRNGARTRGVVRSASQRHRH